MNALKLVRQLGGPAKPPRQEDWEPLAGGACFPLPSGEQSKTADLRVPSGILPDPVWMAPLPGRTLRGLHRCLAGPCVDGTAARREPPLDC